MHSCLEFFNPPRVKMRLRKHRKVLYLLKCFHLVWFIIHYKVVPTFPFVESLVFELIKSGDAVEVTTPNGQTP